MLGHCKCLCKHLVDHDDDDDPLYGYYFSFFPPTGYVSQFIPQLYVYQEMSSNILGDLFSIARQYFSACAPWTICIKITCGAY